MITEVNSKCYQFFRIGNIADGFNGTNSYVDLVEEFGQDRGLDLGGRHVAILDGSSRVRRREAPRKQ